MRFEHLVWRPSTSGYLVANNPIVLVIGLLCLQLAQPSLRFINGYTCQPWREFIGIAQITQIFVGFAKHILHQIFDLVGPAHLMQNYPVD